MKRILQRTQLQEYTLDGIQGRELKDLTVGVIGTGRIGRTVIQNLSGFGCKILANDLYEKEEVKSFASYVSLEEIWENADVITLHTPLMFLDKAATWRLAEELGGQPLVDIILEESHTCYEGERGRRFPWGYGCGVCPACLLRRRGYEAYMAEKKKNPEGGMLQEDA